MLARVHWLLRPVHSRSPAESVFIDDRSDCPTLLRVWGCFMEWQSSHLAGPNNLETYTSTTPRSHQKASSRLNHDFPTAKSNSCFSRDRPPSGQFRLSPDATPQEQSILMRPAQPGQPGCSFSSQLTESTPPPHACTASRCKNDISILLANTIVVWPRLEDGVRSPGDLAFDIPSRHNTLRCFPPNVGPAPDGYERSVAH